MTSLASKLGHVGAERLSSEIGDYFNVAIRIIENNGGDVVKVRGCYDIDTLLLRTSFQLRNCYNETVPLTTW